MIKADIGEYREFLAMLYKLAGENWSAGVTFDEFWVAFEATVDKLRKEDRENVN